MPTELTLTQFALIAGAISGFVLGLIPLILGFIKKKIRYGVIGFVLSLIVGPFLSLLGAIPVAAIFTWLILRKEPAETAAETVSENEVEVSKPNPEQL